MCYDRYFTYWALAIYVLRAVGVVPYNVLPLALIVLAASLLIDHYVKVEKTPMHVDFTIHYLPVLLAWAFESGDWREGLPFFGVMFVTYLAYHAFDVCLLHLFYQYPMSTCHVKYPNRVEGSK